MAETFSHPWRAGLFADPEMSAIWSAEAELGHMLAFEAAWSRAGHLAGLWSEADGQSAAVAIEGCKISPSELAEGTGRDGVCVPDLVKRLKSLVGSSALHRGATSQDVIDTALVLMLRATRGLIEARLVELANALDRLEAECGHAPLMGRTRMQAATLITVRDRLQSWRLPLGQHLNRLRDVAGRTERVQVGGASGDRGALGGGADAVVASVAKQLGLQATDKAWHAMRDGVAEYASVLSLISGTLGKIGQDMCLMAQQGVDEIAIRGGGGSSAMPHKQNPVLAELLVTLARFNAVQVGGMHQALVHEQERSGAAWALEWMILPQIAQTTGRGLVAALTLVQSIERIGTA